MGQVGIVLGKTVDAVRPTPVEKLRQSYRSPFGFLGRTGKTVARRQKKAIFFGVNPIRVVPHMRVDRELGKVFGLGKHCVDKVSYQSSESKERVPNIWR